ncbi:MAG: hypothetical protein U1D33_01495, partial [bacterium]|nr:hypothetical protein [bacterium]
SWQDQRDGNWEVYFTRIDADGNKLENDVRVTNTAGESTPQSLAWNDLDREYAIYIREQVFEGPNRSFQIARIFGNFSR